MRMAPQETPEIPVGQDPLEQRDPTAKTAGPGSREKLGKPGRPDRRALQVGCERPLYQSDPCLKEDNVYFIFEI